jgi:hypothetical protein
VHWKIVEDLLTELEDAEQLLDRSRLAGAFVGEGDV